ncbi:MAG: DUF3524 domain-containing protein [Acidimicrobiales bacterium]|nr:DUF3524 domain-containing protein [Acidimicrobiales bacterium]
MGGSHAAWASGLSRHSRHQIDVVSLPDRGWRWRLRASAPWFARQIEALPETPDVVLVSGLTDVASLRGLIGRELPLVLYMHESQAPYPRSSDDDGVEAAVRNWTAMLAADQVWFNSAYHQRVAMEAVSHLNDAMPQEQRVHTRDAIRAKSRVVYPGVHLSWTGARGSRTTPPVILWPHRWEHDKNPKVFESALDRLVVKGLDFALVLAGADGTPPSSHRKSILVRHADRVVAAGPFELSDYRQWLHRSDLVVSCTAHEFFGLAVVEALAAGCMPVLPNDFSYPEVLGDDNAAFLYEPGTFGSALETAVKEFPGRSVTIDVTRFDWSHAAPLFDRYLEASAHR